MFVDKRNKCLGSVYVYYLIKQNTPKNGLLTTCKTVYKQIIDKMAYAVILAITICYFFTKCTDYNVFFNPI